MEDHSQKPTILDILNEDCWRTILNYVPTKDLVRSERVSRQWQNLVYLYLQGVRFAVRDPWRGVERRRGSCRVLMVNASTEPVWFETVLAKWGRRVVTIAYDYNAFRSNEAILRGLAEKCPYLENISFSHLCHHFISCDWAASFTALKRVSFRSCSSTTDCCISKILKSNAIEELGIDMTAEVTGSCLTGDVNLTKLKSLFLRECPVDIKHLLTASDRLTSVTKLELLHLADEVYEKLYLVIDRMPQLEHLTLVWEDQIELGSELIDSVGRLSRLRNLDFCLNPNVTDDWLPVLARGCKELRSLTLNNCRRVTAGGVVAFCRGTPVLEELCVASLGRTTDAYALAFIKACPTLTTLDLRDCRQVSSRLPALAALGSRAAPLRLRLAGTAAAGAEHHQIPIVALGSPSATILDILNEDCWRLILNLLHTEDIIRSERVSKQWQHVILRYLQGVHFSIESPCYDKDYFLNLRVLHLMREEDTQELDQITAKWGPNIKKAYCHNTKNLEVLARNCPNLEHIMFLDINDDVLPNGPQGNCWKLKTVFIGRYTNVQMTQVTDDGISKWLDNVYLEELLFLDAEKLTGQVLVDIQLANLTTLSLNYCLNLELRYLLAAADRLTSLKKLQLINFPKKISKDIHLFFDKLPNLEDLNLRWEKDVTVMITHKLAESIGRLELKRLDLSYNQNVNDDWLETVARGCGSQQELVMEGCFGVTSRGVIAMCRAAGPALRHLSVCGLNTMNDCHVEAFITACPNLTSLDLSYCMGISIYLVDTVAQAARGRHLRLYVDNTMVEDFHADPYPWLILDFSEQTSE